MSTTETKATHTATPWQVSGGMVETVARMKNAPSDSGVPIAWMDREYTTPTTPTERDANAEFIVRAVNSHADMLEALEALTGVVRDYVNVYQSSAAQSLIRTTSFQKAEAAIAKARGKE